MGYGYCKGYCLFLANKLIFKRLAVNKVDNKRHKLIDRVCITNTPFVIYFGS